MKVITWYRLTRPARRKGGDKYEPTDKGSKSKPPAEAIYIDQRYSRAAGEPLEVVCVTFDFGALDT